MYIYDTYIHEILLIEFRYYIYIYNINYFTPLNMNDILFFNWYGRFSMPYSFQYRIVRNCPYCIQIGQNLHEKKLIHRKKAKYRDIKTITTYLCWMNHETKFKLHARFSPSF